MAAIPSFSIAAVRSLGGGHLANDSNWNLYNEFAMLPLKWVKGNLLFSPKCRAIIPLLKEHFSFFICCTIWLRRQQMGTPSYFGAKFGGNFPFSPKIVGRGDEAKHSTGYYKKLSYRRGTARCVVSIEILPIATQQCRNYLYNKSWPNRWYEVGDLVGGNAW